MDRYTPEQLNSMSEAELEAILATMKKDPVKVMPPAPDLTIDEEQYNVLKNQQETDNRLTTENPQNPPSVEVGYTDYFAPAEEEKLPPQNPSAPQDRVPGVELSGGSSDRDFVLGVGAGLLTDAFTGSKSIKQQSAASALISDAARDFGLIYSSIFHPDEVQMDMTVGEYLKRKAKILGVDYTAGHATIKTMNKLGEGWRKVFPAVMREELPHFSGSYTRGEFYNIWKEEGVVPLPGQLTGKGFFQGAENFFGRLPFSGYPIRRKAKQIMTSLEETSRQFNEYVGIAAGMDAAGADIKRAVAQSFDPVTGAPHKSFEYVANKGVNKAYKARNKLIKQGRRKPLQVEMPNLLKEFKEMQTKLIDIDTVEGATPELLNVINSLVHKVDKKVPLFEYDPVTGGKILTKFKRVQTEEGKMLFTSAETLRTQLIQGRGLSKFFKELSDYEEGRLIKAYTADINAAMQKEGGQVLRAHEAATKAASEKATIMKDINSYINSTETWKIFRDAFSGAQNSKAKLQVLRHAVVDVAGDQLAWNHLVSNKLYQMGRKPGAKEDNLLERGFSPTVFFKNYLALKQSGAHEVVFGGVPGLLPALEDFAAQAGSAKHLEAIAETWYSFALQFGGPGVAAGLANNVSTLMYGAIGAATIPLIGANVFMSAPFVKWLAGGFKIPVGDTARYGGHMAELAAVVSEEPYLADSMMAWFRPLSESKPPEGRELNDPNLP